MQKIFDQKILLANYWLPLAEQEDDWDDLVRMECGSVATEEKGNSCEETYPVFWVDAIEHAQANNTQRYREALQKDKQIAMKMQEIVDAETKLALEEGQTIIRGRRGKKAKIIRPS